MTKGSVGPLQGTARRELLALPVVYVLFRSGKGASLRARRSRVYAPVRDDSRRSQIQRMAAITSAIQLNAIGIVCVPTVT